MTNIELHIQNIKVDYSKKFTLILEKKLKNELLDESNLEDLAFGMRLIFFVNKDNKTTAYINDFFLHYSIDLYEDTVQASWDIISVNSKTGTYFYNEFFTKPLSNKMTKEKFLQKAIILPIENNNFNFESFEPSFKLQELLKDNDSVNLIKSLYPFILKEFINENKKINDSFDKYKIAYNEAELSYFNKQLKVCLKNNFKDLLNGEFKEIVQQFNTQNLLNNFNNACPPSTHISTVKRHKI